MSKAANQHSIRKAPLFTPYVVTWTTFGFLSLGLLGIIGIAPEWLDDLRPASVMSNPESNQGQRAAARLAADVTSLRDTVVSIQLDLAKVQTAVAAYNDGQKALGAQVASLEARVTSSPADVTAKAEGAAATTAAALSPPAQSVDVAATIAAAQSTAPPATIPKIINADPAARPTIETGSLSAPATSGATTVAKADAAGKVVAFGPAIVKPAPKPVGIKITSAQSIDSLRLNWTMLTDQHGDALATLEPRYRVSGDAQNPNFDLVAGPIKTKAEAAKVCKTLVAKGIECSVGAFAGEAL